MPTSLLKSFFPPCFYLLWWDDSVTTVGHCRPHAVCHHNCSLWLQRRKYAVNCSHPLHTFWVKWLEGAGGEALQASGQGSDLHNLPRHLLQNTAAPWGACSADPVTLQLLQTSGKSEMAIFDFSHCSCGSFSKLIKAIPAILITRAVQCEDLPSLVPSQERRGIRGIRPTHSRTASHLSPRPH